MAFCPRTGLDLSAKRAADAGLHHSQLPRPSPHRQHNDRFRAKMDRLVPQWRLDGEELNTAPLSHESRGGVGGFVRYAPRRMDASCV